MELSVGLLILEKIKEFYSRDDCVRSNRCLDLL